MAKPKKMKTSLPPDGVWPKEKLSIMNDFLKNQLFFLGKEDEEDRISIAQLLGGLSAWGTDGYVKEKESSWLGKSEKFLKSKGLWSETFYTNLRKAKEGEIEESASPSYDGFDYGKILNKE